MPRNTGTHDISTLLNTNNVSAVKYGLDVIVDVQNGLPFWTPLLGKPVVNVTHHVHREQWGQVFGPRRAGVGWWLESRLAPRVYRHSRYFAVSDAVRRLRLPTPFADSVCRLRLPTPFSWSSLGSVDT